jgi:protein SCO1
MKRVVAISIRIFSVFALLSLLAGNASATGNSYKRTIENYTVPDVVLVNQDGHKVHLKTYLQSDHPVVVEFIFCTCTAICPILSAGYANLQQKLGADFQKVKLVSISIDPENDTPKVMKEYLIKYRAKPGWDFLTGSRADIDNVMQTFKACTPNKMSHFPLTLIRSPLDGKWVRIIGLLSSSEFMNEFSTVGAK